MKSSYKLVNLWTFQPNLVYYHHHHHHHQVMLLARISLTFFFSLSLSPSVALIHRSRKSSKLHLVSAQSHCKCVLAGRPTRARPYEAVHRRTSLMDSFLLLQQRPACLVHLTWMVLEMRGKWPHSCCFVRCCFQNLFSIAHSNLAGPDLYIYTYIYIYIGYLMSKLSL